ncbi:8-oxo-dGTP pyrophosphatase MutT, NUDIX family [Cognatiyoonia koreensis]|uniref:8-oxo-dGTP pyrophosphatase MutT, NUDIX family n=1 Tax=Cognatiyoonia koreensis TaxID=364200 RepID=A0A1I0MR39_9RHOB|nr:NUDIX hydrolase [Cognatiyoonia koreensis]SEV90757.1 8-oxo-dGTP pyrophosphatase MutT, NUDIX family [Cognatiyoonia koreensis]
MPQQATKKKKRQLPLKLREGGKTDVRTQFAALCYRVTDGTVEVCLVTSRKSKRWILPKGWPMHKQTPAAAAATEAWEEAGVTGQPIDHCLGAYSYVKPLSQNPTPVIVMVYPVKITNIASKWPEKKQRKRKWVPQRIAAKKLQEPELRRIVATFDPERLEN